ncbi:hypothetical protein [Shewanella gaetbuli]|uniref:Uncharacterized protein n=1 Tax=Shewanella gaetbuli TaxID=220752 RepID=A0A9X1ZPJ3_9GAMM|nr:hypothetical protein [Shewanella gaetbuli]MCL1141733.1 hypothetical protein [Shewanella gaetbuli]
MFNKSLIIIGLLSVSSMTIAETVVPNTFAAGDSIVAADMNENFSAIAGSVDENMTLIEDLIARVEALEAGMTSSVAGRTYHLAQIGVLNRGKVYADNTLHNTSMTVGNLSQNYTLTISSGNTFTFIGSENEGETHNTGAVETLSENLAVSATGTYVQDGATLTLTFDGSGDEVEFVVSKAGSSLLSSQFYAASDDGDGWTRIESSFLAGVEIE